MPASDVLVAPAAPVVGHTIAGSATDPAPAQPEAAGPSIAHTQAVTGPTVTIERYNSWEAPDGARYGTLNLKVTNMGPQTLVKHWTLALDVAGAKAVTRSWNWTPTFVEPTVLVGKTSEDWQAMEPGQSSDLVVSLALQAGQLRVSNARINDVPCPLEN